MAFPGWPEPRFVETNGLRMGYYEAGPKDKTPIIFCHGFPELAFSWRHQVRDLAARGFHVIAPDQRGYGLTPYKGAVEDFDMEHLTADLIGLADALGIEKAVWCGHDWGGIVSWQIPLRYPDRVAGMIGVNTPFMRRYPIDPIEMFRKAFGDDMYIVHFQKPDEADAILEADPKKTMRFFMRYPRNQTTGAGLGAAETDAPGTSGGGLGLVHALARYNDPGNDGQILTPEELDFFAGAFAKSGFTGPINWYRNFTRNWQRSGNLPDQVTAPSLMIMAELDVVLSPAMADGMERNVPNLTKHLVKGSGHWTQQEKPDEVTSVIANWMGKTFA